MNTILSILRSIEDLVDPSTMKGVYFILCYCDIPYDGKIGWSI